MHTGKIYNFPEGELLLIDKPLDWTSFDAVNKIRWTISRNTGIKKIKVGHAGTLDPLATGLLIICTGKFTKRISELQLMDKEYTGTFFLGATTPSFDRETQPDLEFPTSHISNDLIEKAIKGLTGDIQQIPPSYSAIKVDGKRSYRMARKNDPVELKARDVHIAEFEIKKVNLPEVEFRVVCSKGTYIRSLARDFGEAVDSGAHLSALRRTRIGNFSVNDAMTIEEFIDSVHLQFQQNV